MFTRLERKISTALSLAGLTLGMGCATNNNVSKPVEERSLKDLGVSVRMERTHGLNLLGLKPKTESAEITFEKEGSFHVEIIKFEFHGFSYDIATEEIPKFSHEVEVTSENVPLVQSFPPEVWGGMDGGRIRIIRTYGGRNESAQIEF